MSSFRNSF